MADTKISQLATLAAANIAAGDVFPIVDVSDTSMAATGTTKKVDATAFAKLTGSTFSDLTVSGVTTVNTIKSIEQAVADDAVYSFAFNSGFILVGSTTDNSVVAIVHVRTVSGFEFVTPVYVGTNTNTTTGVLAGTTGTDGKFTISASNGTIYFENRRGGSRTVRCLFIQ